MKNLGEFSLLGADGTPSSLLLLLADRSACLMSAFSLDKANYSHTHKYVCLYVYVHTCVYARSPLCGAFVKNKHTSPQTKLPKGMNSLLYKVSSIIICYSI